MELTVPSLTPTYKLETATGISYDPEIMAMAQKLSSSPSINTVQNQAVIQSPGGVSFLNNLTGAVKTILTTIPLSFKVGEYTVQTPAATTARLAAQGYIVPTIQPKSFLETYLPYILIGGAGIALFFAFKK